MKATNKKAIPAKKKLPVRNHTTTPIIAPGNINRITLATNMITNIPTTSRRISNTTSAVKGKKDNSDEKDT